MNKTANTVRTCATVLENNEVTRIRRHLLVHLMCGVTVHSSVFSRQVLERLDGGLCGPLSSLTHTHVSWWSIQTADMPLNGCLTQPGRRSNSDPRTGAILPGEEPVWNELRLDCNPFERTILLTTSTRMTGRERERMRWTKDVLRGPLIPVGR